LAGLFVFVLPLAGGLVDVGARILLKLARDWRWSRHCAICAKKGWRDGGKCNNNNGMMMEVSVKPFCVVTSDVLVTATGLSIIKIIHVSK
jgi:hypothetical protein